MTKLTHARIKTRYYGEGSRPLLVPAKMTASSILYAGGMVALTAAGLITSAADASALYAVGRTDATYDNRTSLLPKDIEYRRGVFNWDNDGSITQADVGKKAAIVDDQTVGTFQAGEKLAGVILFIDDKGVWVESSPELALTLT